MNLLVVDPTDETLHWLQRLFRKSHRLIPCRQVREAADRLRDTPGIDGVVMCSPENGEEDFPRLSSAKNPAPIILRLWKSETGSSDPARPRSGRSPGKPSSAAHLTRLELHRLLVGPGGAYEDEELAFVYSEPNGTRGDPIRHPPCKK